MPTVAAAQLASVEAALDAAELNLSFTRVTAPIAGRVSRAIVTAGNLVDGSIVLTTVVSDEPVYAYFDVDEQTYLEHVQRRVANANGSVVHVGLINEHGYPHVARARLRRQPSRPESRHDSRARGARQPRRPVHAGLVRAHEAREPAAATAPRSSTIAPSARISASAFVFVVDEQGVVQYRSVETGRLVEGLRVVTNGLAAGDVVIVNGLQRVRPGVTVAADARRDGPRPARARAARDRVRDDSPSASTCVLRDPP